MDPGKASKIARRIWETINGKIPKGYEIDHIDCNIENNEISNLRICTHAENTRNRKKWNQNRSVKKSVYKGVYWCKKRNFWISQIRYKGITYYIGQFDNEYMAHLSWCEKAKELYGEFFRQS